MAFIYFDYIVNGKTYTKREGNPSLFLKYRPEATITGITAELSAGDFIPDAIRKCKEIAKECNIPVRFEVNGIEVTVNMFSPDDLFEDAPICWALGLKKLGPKRIETVKIPKSIIKDIIRYCEDLPAWDKMGKYNNFYYKIKSLKDSQV